MLLQVYRAIIRLKLTSIIDGIIFLRKRKDEKKEKKKQKCVLAMIVIIGESIGNRRRMERRHEESLSGLQQFWKHMPSCFLIAHRIHPTIHDTKSPTCDN